MRTLRIVILAICLGVAGCGTAGTNTTGTPTNAAEQAAGVGYTAYIAADTAWLAYLTAATKPDKALIAKVEPKRKAAKVALDTFAAASVTSNAAGAQAAFAAALKAYQDILATNGVK